MTNEQQKAKELAKLLTAFAEGKQLQFLNDEGYWCDYQATIKDIVEEFLTIEDIQIRIKPETKRVPLTQQDLIDRIKEGKTMWIKHNITNHIENIIAFTPMFVSLHSHIDSVEYLYLMELGTFLDGTPCYKEVEDE